MGSADGFAGGNGAIGYGWSSLFEPELGPSTSELAIKTVVPSAGTSRTLRGCQRTDGQPTGGDCTISYADPAYSPNGTRIAFDAGAALALLDADGGAPRLLPAHSPDDGEPWFSPTGTRLVFSAGASASQAGARRDLWVSGVFGERARRLTGRGGSDPVWSARDRIAFVRGGQVWVVRPDGRGLRQVTRRGGFAPAWSPHGTQLAFARRGGLFALDLRSNRLRRVWDAGATNLAWSPDGRRFAVHVFDSGVWTVGAGGRGARQLVAGGVNATSNFDANGVDWQPLR